MKERDLAVAIATLVAVSFSGLASVGCASLLGADFDHGAAEDGGAGSELDANANGASSAASSGDAGSGQPMTSASTSQTGADAGDTSNTSAQGDDAGDTSGTSPLGDDAGAAKDSGSSSGEDAGSSEPAAPGFVIGTASSLAPISLSDTIDITVNSTKVASGAAGSAGSGAAGPFTIDAKPGDHVVVSFFQTRGGAKSHSDIWLGGPDISNQKIESSFSGAGSSYPADTVQPFDIVAFDIPTAGGAAKIDCLPDVPLNTSTWTKSSNLTIVTATTAAYDLVWAVGPRTYNYTPDCQGWVTDTFIAPDQTWGIVSWNTITHAMKTTPSSGHAYNGSSDATYAVQTTFPGGDLGLLSVQ